MNVLLKVSEENLPLWLNVLVSDASSKVELTVRIHSKGSHSFSARQRFSRHSDRHTACAEIILNMLNYSVCIRV